MLFYHFSINCHDWDYFPYDFSGLANCVTIFNDFPWPAGDTTAKGIHRMKCTTKIFGYISHCRRVYQRVIYLSKPADTLLTWLWAFFSASFFFSSSSAMTAAIFALSLRTILRFFVRSLYCEPEHRQHRWRQIVHHSSLMLITRLCVIWITLRVRVRGTVNVPHQPHQDCLQLGQD